MKFDAMVYGTPVIYTTKLQPGEWQFVHQFLFCGTGTNLIELAEKLDQFDAEFLRKLAITPYKTR